MLATLRPAPLVVATALLAPSCAAPVPDEVSAGDLVLRTRQDGSFDLNQYGRVLLAAPAAPVRLRQQNDRADLLWGQFDFDPGDVTEAVPSRRAGARAEGDAVILELDGDGAAATLRFAPTPGRPGEITVTLRADAPALARNSVAFDFACDEAARFLGFGEQYQAIEHRGEALPLWVSEQGIGRDPARPSPFAGNPTTTYFPVPFFLDPRGHGFAVDTSARVTFDLCRERPDVFRVTADEEGDVTLRLYAGPTVADVLRVWTERQGRARAAPRWSVEGAWIGVQGGPERVRDAVARAEAAGAPVAAAWVQDWVGKLELGGGLKQLKYRWSVDETMYPDLAGLITELRAGGVRFLGYFNPFVVPKYELFAPAAEQGYLVRRDDGSPYTFLITVFEGGLVDLTNPDAVEWFRGHARAAIALGMDGWMGDFGEWLPYDARLHAGDPRLEHNLYPGRWHRAWKDLVSDEQVVFTRSGWLGEAHDAQVVWTGDQEADFSPYDGLPTVVPAMISLGLAGIGWVTHDIAGFSGGPSTKELYLRWMELGAFTPIFRTHEGLDAGNNWYWHSDAETLAAFSRWARVHAALADELVRAGDVHRATGMPIVRALALAFPDDPTAVRTSDEYLLGDDLLVAPVVTEGAVEREVYFPAGAWFDAWDPAVSHAGPKRERVAAPIGRPPVYSRSARTDLAAIR